MLGAETGTISFDFRSRSDGNLFTLRAPEGCKAYQENLAKLESAGFTLIAVGSQSVEKMNEFKQSVGANFIFLSNENFELESPLNLQTFTTNDGKKFYRRQTLIMKNGKIVKRFNDVAEPASDAANVLAAIERL